MIKYKTVDGTNYLILLREKGQPSFDCPFCRENHKHGDEDGHRAAHCRQGCELSIKADDGTELFVRNGYFIETI